ncbi:TIGR03086 family metal-binding protein [Actinomadura sp. 9N215]|uniref:TIGR03086 family metal-binding protein n=1 Tax=Actinomadura sp. 9N215 TaxID=3375150 RepID=UPI0037BBA19A
MNPEQIPGTADVVRLLERAFGDTAARLAAVPAEGWDADSPCAGWTVRHVAAHLVGGLSLVERYAREEPIDAAEADGTRAADLGLLGDDPAKAFRSAAERCAATFAAFGPLDREVPFVIGRTPGFLLTRVCLLESLVHGWDIAHGSGTPYRVDAEVVGAVAAFAHEGPIEERRAAGMFGPELAAGPDDSAFNRLLAFLGRRNS